MGEEQVKAAPVEKKDEEDVGRAFKWFHATSVNGTAMTISAVIASYFSAYMTDTLGIAAGAASGIMFVSTLWDAINDPLMGVVSDRTHTRFGKYRPYFLIAPILLTVFATLLWTRWEFNSTAGQIAYILLIYIGYGMTVTLYTMPQMAILPAAVKDDKKRNTIITMGAGCCSIAFLIGNTFTTNITGFFENHGFSNGYIPFMLICGAGAAVSFWGLFATSKGKEKYIQKTEKQDKVWKQLVIVLRHKEVYPYLVAWVMAALGYGLMFSSSVYYMTYYYERPDLISAYMMVISIGASVSMIVLMPIFLKVFKTGGRAIIASQAMSIVCYIFLFFFGKTSFVFLCILTFISACTSAMQNALVNVLVNDTIDFIQLKEGKSANGVVSSIKGFAQKCGNTLNSSGLLAVLAISGYVAGEIGNQPASAMFALNFMKFGAPCITGIVLILCVALNPIRKYRDQIAEMKAGMKAAE